MKRTKVSKYTCVFALALSIVVLVGCGGTSSTSTQISSPSTTQMSTPTHTSSTSAEQPVPVGNSNQASGSDIPDTQVFVKYTSSAGKYQLDVPEGWAQTANGTDASFVSNLNAMQVTLTNVPTQPTASSVRTDQAVTLQQTGRAIRDVQVQNKQLPSSPAILMIYSSNSDPNAVTGKQVRLENNRYLFFHNGKLATLTLSAPVGADNVDQWARISASFTWE